MKTIDTEHHFTTPLYMETLTHEQGRRLGSEEGKGLAYWEDAIIPIGKTGAGPKLADMGEGRIKAMDEAGVDFAVLSLTAPGVEPLDPADRHQGRPRRQRPARRVRGRLPGTAGRHGHRLGERDRRRP